VREIGHVVLHFLHLRKPSASEKAVKTIGTAPLTSGSNLGRVDRINPDTSKTWLRTRPSSGIHYGGTLAAQLQEKPDSGVRSPSGVFGESHYTNGQPPALRQRITAVARLVCPCSKAQAVAAAARKLVEIANSVKAVQDGRSGRCPMMH
jgi:hypothetical protein